MIKSTRGNIYDRNGEELATNVLAYSLPLRIMELMILLRKNLTLNGIAYKVLKILESTSSISTGFHIVLDEQNYAFDVDEDLL